VASAEMTANASNRLRNLCSMVRGTGQASQNSRCRQRPPQPAHQSRSLPCAGLAATVITSGESGEQPIRQKPTHVVISINRQGERYFMSPRICVCCAEPITGQSESFSSNPNLCASCFNLTEGMYESSPSSIPDFGEMNAGGKDFQPVAAEPVTAFARR